MFETQIKESCTGTNTVVVSGKNRQISLRANKISQIVEEKAHELRSKLLEMHLNMADDPDIFEILFASSSLEDFFTFKVDQIIFVYDLNDSPRTITLTDRLMEFSCQTPFFMVNEITTGNQLERMMKKICREFIINMYLQLDPLVFFDVDLPLCHLQANSYYFISTGYYWNPGFSNLCRIRDILSQIPEFDNSNKVTAPQIKHLPDAMTKTIDPIDTKLLFNVTLLQNFKALTQFLKLAFFNPFVEGLNSASADLVTWKQLKYPAAYLLQ
jgi:hypothetical protein